MMQAPSVHQDTLFMTRTTLKPSTMHRILASPLGRPLASGVFNDLKLAMLPREFRMARARAAAFQHDEPEAFLAALGADQEAKRKLVEPAARALTELADTLDHVKCTGSTFDGDYDEGDARGDDEMFYALAHRNAFAAIADRAGSRRFTSQPLE